MDFIFFIKNAVWSNPYILSGSSPSAALPARADQRILSSTERESPIDRRSASIKEDIKNAVRSKGILAQNGNRRPKPMGKNTSSLESVPDLESYFV